MKMTAMTGLLVAVLQLSVGCDLLKTESENRNDEPEPSTAITEEQEEAVGVADSAAVPTSASTDTEEGGLATLFDGLPTNPDAATEPVRKNYGFTGAVVVIPEGWRGHDVYGDDLVVNPKGGDHDKAMLIFHAERLTSDQEKAEEVSTAVLDKLAYHTKAMKVRWEEPVSGKLGREHDQAYIWKGKGLFVAGKPERTVYAANVVVGKNKRVTVVGSVNVDEPELEKALIEAFKGLKG